MENRRKWKLLIPVAMNLLLVIPAVVPLFLAYRVTWSSEDNEFVATCIEFPSLSWLAPSKSKAIEGLEQLLEEVIADMSEHGEEVPQAFSDRSYSGKFNVRVGESLHRSLAMHAAEDGMSLNQYIVSKLTASC